MILPIIPLRQLQLVKGEAISALCHCSVKTKIIFSYVREYRTLFRFHAFSDTLPMPCRHVSSIDTTRWKTRLGKLPRERTVRSRANGIPFSDQLQEISGIFPFARIPICSRITCKEIGFPFWCFGAFECSKLSHLTRNVSIFNHSA